MKFDSEIISQNFKNALIKELQSTPLAVFESFWYKGPDRTQYYKSKLLPQVARELGYDFLPEFLLVDYAFLNNERVPVVFIESEHSHESAVRETDKLCAVCSPVKVLFLCCSWYDGVRKQFLPRWQERIATHHKYSCGKAVYFIVVGERGRGNPEDHVLRYYIESYNESGEEIFNKTITIEK